MDETFIHAHGTAMILAWMVFGSTGVLFARYGRVLRFGNQRQLFGKSIWFQTHRFLLSLSSLLTLLGFFFVIVYNGATWVDPNTDGIPLFAHSIFGSLVVCFVILQIWLALYRCGPRSRFRFIFNWSHRIIGSLAFGFSLTTLFLIFALLQQKINLIMIFSFWIGWFVIVVTLFEIIQYQYRRAAALMARNARINNINQEVVNRNPLPDTEEVGGNPIVDNQYLNQVKLILLFIHAIISVVLCIPLIVMICNDPSFESL